MYRFRLAQIQYLTLTLWIQTGLQVIGQYPIILLSILFFLNILSLHFEHKPHCILTLLEGFEVRIVHGLVPHKQYDLSGYQPAGKQSQYKYQAQSSKRLITIGEVIREPYECREYNHGRHLYIPLMLDDIVELEHLLDQHHNTAHKRRNAPNQRKIEVPGNHQPIRKCDFDPPQRAIRQEVLRADE